MIGTPDIEKRASAVARVGTSDVAAGLSRIITGVTAGVLLAGVVGGVALYGTQQSIKASVRANTEARISVTASLQRSIDANTAAIVHRTERITQGEITDAKVAERLDTLSRDMKDVSSDIARLRSSTASALSEISRKLDR